eukprot:TRINITY_DN43150_c0_g1_i1.p1 TRINITY_DN43150_c0_g1~~TRINITY_DN43150_c0_g1_i1.p1  ORF type:complete len:546 (-),score=90.24 TRINITY_DN43150_c0_g1_i1:99-1577(-)
MAMSAPTEEVILQYIAERESLKQARRFAESDNIRDQLRNMGVEVYDKEKEWRSRDGRKGPLFTAGPAPCTLSDAEIFERITAREDARSAKDWAKADIYRDDLRRNGVELDDRSRTWRTATGRCGTYSGTVQASAVALTEEQIRSMIADRERARAGQDFNMADEIRRRLMQMGVELFDNERLWKANDGRQGLIVTGGVDLVQCPLADVDIQGRVALREEARGQKDWVTADAYRDELRRFGVELIDNEQKWRTTDGRIGSYSGNILSLPVNHQQQPVLQPQQLQNPFLQPLPQWPAFVTASGLGAGGLPGSVEAYAAHANAAAAQILMAQQQAAIQAHFAAGCMPVQTIGAPLPMTMPMTMPAVGLVSGPVGIVGGTPLSNTPPVPAAAVGSSLSNASIDALVVGRETVREGRDFSSADSIREDLRTHGVELWDKHRTWKSMDGRSGVYPTLAGKPAMEARPMRQSSTPPAPPASRAQGMSADLAAVMALASRI